ncbi:Exocyst complex component [Thalictrum thalictroides]|uniref:Exocyst complex component n=1 Tax=Thalictrum thalictroides TaxID=46969 RepID=A0A7J6UYF5_THATH|nr:Exocyst complex component [Thalictrum thalictroides]
MLHPSLPLCLMCTCRIVRSFIEDSVSYLSYGGRMSFYDVVKKYLDKLLIDVLNEEALLKTINSPTTGVSKGRVAFFFCRQPNSTVEYLYAWLRSLVLV